MLDLQWPYKRHTGIFAGAQRYAEAHAWESTIDDYIAEKLPQRKSATVPYDGIIARATKKLLRRAAHLNIPLVNVWMASPVWRQLPGVFPDCETTGRLRAEHLLSRGLRRFAVFGNSQQASKIEVTAFKQVVSRAGFPCHVLQLPLRPRRSFAQWQKFENRIAQALTHWQLPIGVFAFSDDVGRVIAQLCRVRGWRVPHDVAIIAGSNEESHCEHPRPSLTSIEFGFERIGYEAAQLLDQLMQARTSNARRRTAPKHLFLPPNGLVVRESSDFFAVDDPTIAAALEFIAANSQRQINAADVARATHVGLRTLQRQFSEYLQRSISAEIQRVRIERAKRELTQSSRSVNEIARDVGFGRAMRMYEAFRRELGVAPRDYRKLRQLDKEP